MTTESITIAGRELTLSWSPFSGLEEIRVDGELVSRKRNFLPVSRHRFALDGDGTRDDYRVNLSRAAGFVVARNGEIVFERHSLWVQYFNAVGLMVLLLLVAEGFAYLSLALLDRDRLMPIRRLVDVDLAVVFLLAIPTSFLMKHWLRRVGGAPASTGD